MEKIADYFYNLDIIEQLQTKIFFPEVNDKLSKNLGKIKRDELGKMVSFITGHCNMNRHLNLIDASYDLNCRFSGEAEETPEHVMKSCPSLVSGRLEIFKALQSR